MLILSICIRIRFDGYDHDPASGERHVQLSFVFNATSMFTHWVSIYPREAGLGKLATQARAEASFGTNAAHFFGFGLPAVGLGRRDL